MFDSPQNNQFSQQKSQKKNSLRSLVLILGFFAIASLGIITLALLQKWNVPASAAPGIYKALNYQGKLEDTGGIPVADGPYNIIFTIYDAASGGNVLWTARESDACGAPFNPAAKSVTVSKGVFSTMFGESGDCPLDLNFNDDSYYLGMTVGADSEMTPRKRIGAAGYAFNADLLDGLDTSLVGGTSSFVPATDASGNFVLTGNVTFDTTTFFVDSANDNIGVGTVVPDADRTLDLATAKKYGIYSVTSSASKETAAVYGQSTDATNNTRYGGYFTAAGGSGRGVFGEASEPGNAMIANYGGYFTSAGASGIGVHGEASASGMGTSNTGGDFTAAGDVGYGVRGVASGTAGINYGGYFISNGPGGYGVYSWANDTSATANYGGYFRASGQGGYGVYGTATDTSGAANYGGYFTSAGAGSAFPGGTAAGVYGEATNSSPSFPNFGGYFVSNGTINSAAGVLGWATATGDFETSGGIFISESQKGKGVHGIAWNSGAYETYGVKGESYSIGAGASGVYGYVGGAADNLRGVFGRAANTGAYTNYGGYFTAAGAADFTSGVYGEASDSTVVANFGGYFTSAGTKNDPGGFNAAGVLGAATATGDVMNSGGMFVAYGNTGRGVFGAALSSNAFKNIGVQGNAAGTGDGTSGVYGFATSVGAVTNYGGYFQARGETGRGVYGQADNASGTNYGGYFTAAGNSATAVYGEATATDGANNMGGFFKADGNAADSYGVYALASGAGNNFGIFASTLSATGWAGYFNGGRGIYAYRFSINDGVSEVNYNTIGPAAAGHTAAGEITSQSDLFINGDLEVDGWAWLDGGHTDLAEMVAYNGEGEAGDVIVIDDQSDNSAKLAVKPYDKTVLGVISTKPSLIITGGINEGKLLAIAGRIPTKVTNINGAIHRGDLLTTSSVPGHAMKLTAQGPIVGKAMGECNENSCVIWVFLNISWYGGI